MNKKSLFAGFLILVFAINAKAQLKDAQVNLFAIPTLSTSFVRMPSRNASQEIDAVYYNPAGILGLKNGFHFCVIFEDLEKVAINKRIDIFKPVAFHLYGFNKWRKYRSG